MMNYDLHINKNNFLPKNPYIYPKILPIHHSFSTTPLPPTRLKTTKSNHS